MAWGKWAAALGLVAAAAGGTAVRAEVTELRMATQFGIGAMPMILMQRNHILEKQLEAAGLHGVNVTWRQFPGGVPMNDGLISGSLDIVSGGTTVFVTLWAKAKGDKGVKSIGALSALPLWFLTRDPNVKTLADLTEKDKIGVTTVKVSLHAILLQMAAEKLWGPEGAGRFDALTVTIPHADAAAQIVSGVGEVNNHFSAPPYEYVEMKAPNVRRIVTADDILGGRSSYMVAYTTSAFREANPKTYAAFIAALKESQDYIVKDPKHASADYLDASKDPVSVDETVQMVTDPGASFTMVPERVAPLAEFMFRRGLIKVKPDNWKDMFFPEMAVESGS